MSPSPDKNNPQVSTFSRKQRLARVVAPFEHSILDLRLKLSKTHTIKNWLVVLADSIKRYWLFLVVCITSIIVVITIFLFIKSAFFTQKNYQVTMDNNGEKIIVTSEDIQSSRSNSNSATQGEVVIKVINRSGAENIAEDAKAKIEASGLVVNTTESDTSTVEKNTVIIYDPVHAEVALGLSKLFDNALLSAYTDERSAVGTVTIYLGADQLDAAKQ